ncbi:transposase [Desulfococcaceae bacterium HSG9]|nr:transposase [Desulfococcaceae bacterium HSG9]
MNNSTAAHKDITLDFTYPQPKNEITIGDISDKSLSLNFDGGDISSDGGALLIRVAEELIGLIKAVAEVIPDSRDTRYVRHTLTDLLIQRVELLRIQRRTRRFFILLSCSSMPSSTLMCPFLP